MLDDVRVSSRRGFRIEASLSQRSPLTEKIPALVQRHLQVLKALAVGLACVPCGLALP